MGHFRKVVAIVVLCLCANINSMLEAAPTLEQDAADFKNILFHLVDAVDEKHGGKYDVQKMEETMRLLPKIGNVLLAGKDVNKILENAELPQMNSRVNRLMQFIPSTLPLLGMVANQYLPYPVESVRKIVNFASDVLFSNTVSVSDKVQLVSVLPETVLSQLSLAVTQKIGELQFSNYKEVELLRDPKLGIDTSFMPKKIASFLNLVLTQYFDHMDISDKKRIVLALAELPPGADADLKLTTIVNNVGPCLQKLFQLAASYAKSPTLVGVLEKLKSQIKPFDGKLAHEIVKRELGDRYGEMFASFNEKPLAAASVGQIHLAKLKSGQEVVVKVLRPNIHEVAEREIKLLSMLAKDDPTLSAFIKDMGESVLEELDYTLEGRNLQEGELYDDPSRGIYPLHLIKDNSGQGMMSKDVLVMEKAAGVPMSKIKGKKLTPENAGKKVQALSNFLQLWFEEALFGSGLYHGDLHEGNLFFEASRRQDQNWRRSPDFQVTAIDFGSVGHLSKEEQSQLLALFLSISERLPSNTASVFKSLAPTMSNSDYKKLYRSIQELFKDKSIGVFPLMGLIVNKVLEMGSVLPKNFVKFNRAITFMENQIYYTNQDLQTIDPSRKIKRGDSIKIYKRVVKQHILKDIIKNFFFLPVSSNAPLCDSTLSAIKKEKLFHTLHPGVKALLQETP
ncbi:MAG: AarF/ABC1/UbiB kinase family protein [Oligoflexia bacterium]|nr:AarF/ABC1/UbiB kinase family protein [Oligoflexia bacterium]MBF0364575.1 AarF/ABC1/UbiB kinase family protein [Oligoflexia bacterium]